MAEPERRSEAVGEEDEKTLELEFNGQNARNIVELNLR